MRHAKRTRLGVEDVSLAMKVKNIEVRRRGRPRLLFGKQPVDALWWISNVAAVGLLEPACTNSVPQDTSSVWKSVLSRRRRD